MIVLAIILEMHDAKSSFPKYWSLEDIIGECCGDSLSLIGKTFCAEALTCKMALHFSYSGKCMAT